MRRQYEICTVEGCGRAHKSRGYCQTHYMQWKRGAPISAVIAVRDRNGPERCTIEGCGEPVKSKGLCGMHYARKLRHGFTKYPERKKPPKPCSIPQCTNWLYSNGLCHQHYIQARKLTARGMKLEDYFQMLKDQDYRCAICEQKETAMHQSGRVKQLSVDHCHDHGHVRGLLCASCNRAIGLLGDDPSRLEKAADYLRKHGSK